MILSTSGLPLRNDAVTNFSSCEFPMDRSTQRGGGVERGPCSANVPGSNPAAEDNSGAQRHSSECHYNAYAEASQARVIRNRPQPIDLAQATLSSQSTGTEQRNEIPTALPALTAAPDPGTGFEAKPTEVANSTLDDPTTQTASAFNPRLMTAEGVASYLGLSVSTVWRLPGKDSGFPPPIKIGGSTRWDRLDLDRYVEERKARRQTGR